MTDPPTAGIPPLQGEIEKPMMPVDFEERATDIACERENDGFDNYVDRIRRALYDAYIAGAESRSLTGEGSQHGRRSAVDPVADRGTEGSTRDEAFEALKADYLRLTEAIRHLQEYAETLCDSLDWADGSTPRLIGEHILGLLSLPRSSTAQKHDDEKTHTRVDGCRSAIRPTGSTAATD